MHMCLCHQAVQFGTYGARLCSSVKIVSKTVQLKCSTDLHEQTVVLGDGDLRHSSKVLDLHVLQLVHARLVLKHLNSFTILL